VSYQQAVIMVTQWATEDDALIKSLDDPTEASKVRQATETAHWSPYIERMMEGIEAEKNNPEALFYLVDEHGNESAYDDGPIYSLQAAKDDIKAIDTNLVHDDAEKLVRYQNVLKVGFGPLVDIPIDLDDRDEFEMVKKKLERRIAELAGDPNTITAVAERYYKHNQIRAGVLRKYRGNIKKLTDHIGDIPITHITSVSLRRFRDQQAAIMQPSSLAAIFTPIRGLFRYAVNEELVDDNPMGSVQLQKDKRSIHEKKWTAFTPIEMRRLFSAMDKFWGSRLRGLSDERRVAIHMVCKVMAYSAMRPVEVIRLEAEDVTDEWIQISRSKTPSSHRTIPLHPALSDFPKFVAGGGLKTFRRLKTDQVEPVRYNFRRLTRDLMDPPIKDEKKVIYSLRSTFSNTMRRAGADPEVRRAILGHAEGGALAHYNDGEEFFKKRKWVRASDPTVIYRDENDSDDRSD
jgi:integrase